MNRFAISDPSAKLRTGFVFSIEKAAGNKTFCFALCALVFALCFPVQAQQPKKIARIGYISGTGNAIDQGPYVEALRQGLRDLGYSEGTNIAIEYRGAESKLDLIPSLVVELVQLKVDVLVVPTLSAARAAKQTTKTIPIVMVTGDPLAAGIVDSLARPGGNITGLATLNPNLSGKRVELLSETIPRLSRLGVLRHMQEPSPTFQEYKSAARALKMQFEPIEVEGPNPDLEGAFRRAIKARIGALITITSAPVFIVRHRVGELALKNRLPTMFGGSAWAEAGGLMSYSPNDIDAFRRAATYVDKILRGAKPGELPIEQSMKFEFVINLKTAKQIGLRIPPNVLARADRVIK